MEIRGLTDKKRRLDAFLPLPRELKRNLDDWFRVELTFTSNAIEGNRLTRMETALVVEKEIAVGGKSLREHHEAVNHAKAFDWIKARAGREPASVRESDILRIHELVLEGIDDSNAGRCRSVRVRIAGSAVAFPNALEVPGLMAEFAAWLSKAGGMHPVELAAEAHFRLASIIPFVNGNGRTARLLMNMILLMNGYPPAVISEKDRLAYFGALERAQLGGSKDDYLEIVANAAEKSLDIYLEAAGGEDGDEDTVEGAGLDRTG